MSGTATRQPRAIASVLAITAGLAIWAAHFGGIYAVHALACEREWASWRVLGLPWAPASVLALTVLALGALALVFASACPHLRIGPWDEGGEAEPRFTAWFAAAAAAYSAVAVLFQAAPALMLPGCG
ncbi:hypothetical protein [Falsiroseomonas oryzae]|uniref:hypothetical protein n=1 Tax=Falsiroseomonas oryzae TaxID=2766473 RepID=UPI0022EA2C0F|nr:hypothetical protein [Roseomonas sp. MO-31]